MEKEILSFGKWSSQVILFQLLMSVLMFYKTRFYGKGPISDSEVEGVNLRGQLHLKGAEVSLHKVTRITITCVDAKTILTIKGSSNQEVSNILLHFHNTTYN